MNIDPLVLQEQIQDDKRTLAPLADEAYDLRVKMSALESRIRRRETLLESIQLICEHEDTEVEYLSHGREKWETCIECGKFWKS